MPFFSSNNYVIYPMDGGDLILKDITTRVVEDILPASDKTLYYTYTMADGMTPEGVAHALYGDATLGWVLGVVNSRGDRYGDWPLNGDQFDAMLDEKYGSVYNASTKSVYSVLMDDLNWVVTTKQTYLATDPSKRKLQSMYDIEVAANDAKREIRVINPKYIANFTKQYYSLASK